VHLKRDMEADKMMGIDWIELKFQQLFENFFFKKKKKKKTLQLENDLKFRWLTCIKLLCPSKVLEKLRRI